MAHLDLQRGTYAAAETLLGRKAERKIGHNTRLERLGDDRIGVRYHATTIYEMRRDGWAVIDTNGWDTVTTWARVNALLPGPWAVHSGGKRGRFLYSGGQPVAPFADGIAVHVGSGIPTPAEARTAGKPGGWDGGGTGAVGYRPGGPEIGVIMSPEDVQAAIDAGKARQAERERKRAERLFREHPEPRTFPREASGLRAQYSYGPDTPMHRGHPWDCASCKAERDAWHALRVDVLTAGHDGEVIIGRNGSDTSDVVATYPPHLDAYPVRYGFGGIRDCPKCQEAIAERRTFAAGIRETQGR